MERLIIAAYNPLIIEGIKKIINEKGLHFDIVGEATRIEQFLDLIEFHSPDLAVVDVAITWRSGKDFVEEVRIRNQDVRVIPISVHPIDRQVLSNLKNRTGEMDMMNGHMEEAIPFGAGKLN